MLLADHRLKYILKGRVTDFYRLQPIAEKSDDKKIRDLTVKKAETESDLEAVSKYVEMFDDYITVSCHTFKALKTSISSHCAKLNLNKTVNRKRQVVTSRNL